MSHSSTQRFCRSRHATQGRRMSRKSAQQFPAEMVQVGRVCVVCLVGQCTGLLACRIFARRTGVPLVGQYARYLPCRIFSQRAGVHFVGRCAGLLSRHIVFDEPVSTSSEDIPERFAIRWNRIDARAYCVEPCFSRLYRTRFSSTCAKPCFPDLKNREYRGTRTPQG